MAQIERTAPAEHDMLLWDLWKLDDPLKTTLPKVDRAEVRSFARPFAAYLGLSLAVMLPLLLPGFILTLDMAFTPELRMPEQMSSSYLFNAALHYLDVLLPADIVQKIMLLSILVTSGLGMHYLVRHIQQAKDGANEFALWGAYIAGFLYMINPYTYSRFMAGQYAVLLGYALLPVFVRALLRFFAVPTLRRSLIASGWLTLVGIVSVHTLGLAAVFMLASLAVFAWRCRKNSTITLNAVGYGLIGIAVFIAASGYWLFPLLDGSSNQGQAIAQFSTSDQAAFQTGGGSVASKLGNVLQLQGFWAEAEGLYLLPQDQLPGWAFIVVLIWILIGAGAVWLWRRQRAIAALFIVSGLAAVVLAITGAGNFAALAGFREPHKFIGLLALAYALFAGMGAITVLAWAKKRRSDIAVSAAVVAVLLTIALFTPTMYWGFAGQLSPRHYPDDWYQMNDALNKDLDNFKVLSLPWHLYTHYQFAGRVIVNPSDRFFDKPVIVSNELEFKDASPTFPDTNKTLLSKQILPAANGGQTFARDLNDLGIKYILLAKTYDYTDYAYLDHQPGLKLVNETQNLKLYRNLTYEQ